MKLWFEKQPLVDEKSRIGPSDTGKWTYVIHPMECYPYNLLQTLRQNWDTGPMII